MKKALLIVFIIGVAFGSLGVYAATTLASSSVSYDNKTSGGSSTTVQGAVDELYNKSSAGKKSIINSLNGKGLSLASNSTYQQIVAGIESLPIGATPSGDIGYKDPNMPEAKPFYVQPTAIKISYKVNLHHTASNTSSVWDTPATETAIYTLQSDGTYSLTSGSSASIPSTGVGANTPNAHYFSAQAYITGIEFVYD